MSTNRHIITLYVDEAAGTDDEYSAVFPLAGEWELLEAWFSPDTAASANGTNYATLSVLGNAQTTAIKEFSTATVANVVGTPRELADAAGYTRALATYTGQVDTIQIDKVDSGTGALFQGSVSLAFEKVANS